MKLHQLVHLSMALTFLVTSASAALGAGIVPEPPAPEASSPPESLVCDVPSFLG